MTPQVIAVWVGGFFGLIVFGAIVAYVLNIFQGIFYNSAGNATTQGYAWNITREGLIFVDNAFSQLANAGSLLGVAFILGIAALLGIGGYYGGRKAGLWG